jgi:hypothetical protein
VNKLATTISNDTDKATAATLKYTTFFLRRYLSHRKSFNIALAVSRQYIAHI